MVFLLLFHAVLLSARLDLRDRPRVRAALFAGALACLAPEEGRAQACCAGATAITPARLALHEDGAAGVQLRAGSLVGSYQGDGRYVASPAGASELDLEQDLLGAVRVLSRGQLSLLVPWVETRRKQSGRVEWGGGLGDVNLGARYDLLEAGRSASVPGVSLLAGITLPTGRAPEAARRPLATDATGLGAYQLTAGASVEQLFGTTFVGVTALLAARPTRVIDGIQERLGAQLSVLGAVAQTFDRGAVGLSLSYATEGDARIDGQTQTRTGRRLTTLGLSGLLSLSDPLRLQGSVSLAPPLGQLGRNQTASLGSTLSLLWAWY